MNHQDSRFGVEVNVSPESLRKLCVHNIACNKTRKGKQAFQTRVLRKFYELCVCVYVRLTISVGIDFSKGAESEADAVL